MTTTCATTIPADAADPVRVIVRCLCGGIISDYTQHPSGVECCDIVEHFNFCVGNAIKYLWRAGLKGDAIEDLRKAAWYVKREIERRAKR